MSDVFRKVYTPITEDQKAFVLQLKTKAEELDSLLLSIKACREVSIARTELESCLMWAVKAATKGE